MAVAQEGVPQSFQRAAELQRETRGYSRVPGGRIALASLLVRLREDLADRAVGMSADRGRIALAGDFKVEAFAGAAVFESLPHQNGIPSSMSLPAPAMAGFLSRIEGLTDPNSIDAATVAQQVDYPGGRHARLAASVSFSITPSRAHRSAVTSAVCGSSVTRPRRQ